MTDNHVVDNEREGLAVMAGSKVSAQRNRIGRNGGEGVYVARRGRIVLEANDLRGNGRGALSVKLGLPWRVRRRDNLE
jgi:hypothetical protein